MSERRIPELPSCRAITRRLRELHEAWSHPDCGGDYVSLVCTWSADAPYYAWRVECVAEIDDGSIAVARSDNGDRLVFGWEEVPGDGKRFDPVGCARRLLAAAKEGL